MKLKLLTLLLAFAAVLSLHAQTSGSCGDNLNWSYNETTKTLTITGSGAMTDYAAAADRPWHTSQFPVHYQPFLHEHSTMIPY
ncbi:MAG: hypothetical protein IJS13_01615 [Paludibacteraceae bacterium]|nr:hypothetical protein [Paludibacteraceae bacterium]